MINRKTLFENQIVPTLQPRGTGCMWHALYALTGNIEFLDHVKEGSAHFMMLKVYELGYLLWPLITLPYSIVINDELWLKVYKYCKEAQHKSAGIEEMKLLISMRMKDYPIVHHTFAVQGSFKEDSFMLSDPVENNVAHYNWKRIKEKYRKNAEIYEVMVLDSGDKDDYPKLSSPL